METDVRLTRGMLFGNFANKGDGIPPQIAYWCYQWVGYRDHAGITCFPHSGSWQAQEGPAYICRDQRRVFYNMGPLKQPKGSSLH